MTEQKERLKKLYALALRGVGGEKEQAQAILDKLLKKYAMTLDDLDDEVIQEYDLEYHGKEQDRILMQTAYKELRTIKTRSTTCNITIAAELAVLAYACAAPLLKRQR